MILVLLFGATCFLAYSNGANDNFKGVASLFGSRTCTYRTAVSWATITTFAGSTASIVLAQSLLKKFSGKGLVPDVLVTSEHFLLAVVIGAAVLETSSAISNRLNCNLGHSGAIIRIASPIARGRPDPETRPRTHH